jgi:hypothetical protein
MKQMRGATPQPIQRNHLLILSADRLRLLVLQIPGSLGYLLPTLVSGAERRVLSLLKAHLYQLRVTVDAVVTLSCRESEPAGSFEAVHLVETIPEENSTTNGLEWKSISELMRIPALWELQREFVLEFVKAGPTLPPAWMSGLRGWVNEVAAKAELGTIEDFVPFRASQSEAVSAFRTAGGENIYVKYSERSPFTEALVTRALGERYSETVAETLDFCPERGWWAAREVRGVVLSEQLTLEGCLCAIGKFAAIQKDLAGCGAAFAEMGLRSLRLRELEPQVDSTLSDLGALDFSVHELAELRALFAGAVSTLAGLDFPESLIHRDLTPWNVKLSRQGPAFLDWEDVTWGPAVVSLEIFLASLRAERWKLRSSGWLQQIRGFYFEVWGMAGSQWDDPSMVRCTRALALFCQLRDFLRFAQSHPQDQRARNSAVQFAQKLHHLLA